MTMLLALPGALSVAATDAGAECTGTPSCQC
jgi:hypothetical protein